MEVIKRKTQEGVAYGLAYIKFWAGIIVTVSVATSAINSGMTAYEQSHGLLLKAIVFAAVVTVLVAIIVSYDVVRRIKDTK